MTSLIVLPSGGDAFSQYRPSKNAHVDIISANGRARRPSGVVGQDSQHGVKTVKLVLKSPIAASQQQDDLPILLASIGPLLSGASTSHSYHHLSASCHRLVLGPHSQGPIIYARVREELERSVAGLAREWRGAIMSREAGWLERLVRGWRDWEARVKLLAAVFVYLDRVYASDSPDVQSIHDLAIATFRQGVWGNEVVFGKTRDDLLSWAAAERQSIASDAVLRPTIIALTALAKLLSTFPTLSTPYLEVSTEHYTSSATSNIEAVEQGTMPATKYVEWVLQKVEEERARAKECLDDEVSTEVVKIVRGEAGAKMGKRIVRRAVDEGMDGKDEQALKEVYRFCVEVEVFEEMVKALREHIEDRLRKIISDPANDSQMIDGTLTLKRFIDNAVANLFVDRVTARDVEMTDMASITASTTTIDPAERRRRRDRQLELEDAIRVGFKNGMSSRQNAPAEWIAKHLDVAMRRGQGSGTEAEFNALLDEIIALVGFTRDKDVFKAFYSSQLAKRLLLSKSASDDMERNMIVKLQREMGEEFTSGDVMMKDLALSETLVKAYHATSASASSFTAHVLTESAWPAYPLLTNGWAFRLTPDLQGSVDAFTEWYSSQHKNRQLSWRWQLATVTLSARFPSGKYEAGVSLFQAVVLLQFNEADTLDFNEIKARTGIESAELVRTLQSLALGRKGTRVLLKKPPGKEVSPTDVFAWNKGFSSDRIKFRINQIQQDMSAEESRKTNEQVAIDRVSVLEATIVRIMKGRKKLTMQLLIDAVVTDVSKRFPPDIKEMKKRVESLIEREFLERDEEDRNLLTYLA